MESPLPELRTDSLKDVPLPDLIRSFWVYNFIARPNLVWLGSKIGEWAVRNLGVARWAVSKTIFAQFCGGESVEYCRPAMQHLAESHISTILDYSVEGAESEEVFDATAQEIADTIREAAKSSNIAFSVFKVSGLGRSALLEELSKKGQYESLNPEAACVVARVDMLCKLAHELGVRIFIDAEHTWEQPFIDHLALVAMKTYNRERAVVFQTYQLYLKDGFQRLQADAKAVWAAGSFFGAKLVRGAYMEREAARAQAEGRPSPINPDKETTDALFDAAAALCLAELDRAAFCLGTHNAQSCLKVAQALPTLGIAPSDKRLWFAQLLGMSDNLSYPLAANGYNVAKYVPYGPVQAVVPYLIRRAQENTTVAGQSSRELTLIKQEVARRKANVWQFFIG